MVAIIIDAAVITHRRPIKNCLRGPSNASDQILLDLNFINCYSNLIFGKFYFLRLFSKIEQCFWQAKRTYFASHPVQWPRVQFLVSPNVTFIEKRLFRKIYPLSILTFPEIYRRHC